MNVERIDKHETKKSDTRKFLEKITGGPVTLGKLIESIRLGDDLSQADLAKKLKISRSNLGAKVTLGGRREPVEV